MTQAVRGAVLGVQAWAVRTASVSPGYCLVALDSANLLLVDAYHAYTTTKSTIINYASAEEGLANDDWFRESGGDVRYG